MENDSAGKNLINLFIAPTKLFNSIKEKPNFLVPLAVTIILLLINGILSSNIELLTPEFQAQQLFEMTGNATSTDLFLKANQAIYASSGGFNIVKILIEMGFVILVSVISTAFTLLLSKLFGGEANFKQLLSLNFYVSIITYTLSTISTLFMLLLNTTNDIFALSTVLMPNGNIFDPLRTFLSLFSVTTIYAAVLSTMGLKIISNFETYKKPIIIALISFIIPGILAVVGVMSTVIMYTNM